MINGQRTPSETDRFNRREAFKRLYGEGMWFGVVFESDKYGQAEELVEAEFQVLDHKVHKGREC